MAKYRYEMFGNIIYDQALTYEELIGREQTLMSEFTAYLQQSGASHIDFQPLGDALYVQCVFAEQDARNFEDVAETVARLSGQHLEGRLVFFGRDLGRIYCFFFADESCLGGRLSLPTPRQGLNKTPPEMQYASSKDRKSPE